MKPCIVLLLLAGLLVSGCAAQSYRIEGNEVTLMLRRPQARQVVLACSLDGFHDHMANRVGDRWEVTLPAGKAFSYFYLVDGAVYLPDCPLEEKDDFGSKNCIFDPKP